MTRKVVGDLTREVPMRRISSPDRNANRTRTVYSGYLGWTISRRRAKGDTIVPRVGLEVLGVDAATGAVARDAGHSGDVDPASSAPLLEHDDPVEHRPGLAVAGVARELRRVLPAQDADHRAGGGRR